MSDESADHTRAVLILIDHGWRGMTVSDAADVLTASGFRLSDLISLDEALADAQSMADALKQVDQQFAQFFAVPRLEVRR